MRMLARWACVCAAVAMSVGCEKTPEDAVLSQYHRGEDAIAGNDWRELRAVLSPASIQRYEEILHAALTAPADAVKKLSPARMEMVLALRNRVDPVQLRMMNVNDLLIWMIDEQMLVLDADMGVYPMTCTIYGDTAEIQMGFPIEESGGRVRLGRRRMVGAAVGLAVRAMKPKELEAIPGWTYKYDLIDGEWYFDSGSFEPTYNATIIEYAKEEKMSVADYLLWIEQETYGEVKPKIWDPPK